MSRVPHCLVRIISASSRTHPEERRASDASRRMAAGDGASRHSSRRALERAPQNEACAHVGIVSWNRCTRHRASLSLPAQSAPVRVGKRAVVAQACQSRTALDGNRAPVRRPHLVFFHASAAENHVFLTKFDFTNKTTIALAAVLPPRAANEGRHKTDQGGNR
jgi:hypothetical protein